MRTIILLFFVLIGASSSAQFSKGTLQASGLTCAMCSNAINKSLQKVSFVESVKSDIRNSAFNIKFKAGQAVDIDLLQKAVEDAGFSVASLVLNGNFDNVQIAKDKHVKIGNNSYHFLNTKETVLTGEKDIRIVDKSFVTAKEFKKFSASTKMKCVETGTAAACCTESGIAAGSRIYHVTM